MLQGGQLGEYSIIEKLGHGSFGQIFTVRLTKSKDIYAAKVEPVYVQHKTIDFEAKVLKALQTSNYFPKFFYFGRNVHFSYLVLELLGPSLTTVLKRLQTSKFTLSTGLRVAIHMLNAIEIMHIQGYVHRDIKPANVLIRTGNIPTPSQCPIALIDFGLARFFLDRQTNAHLQARRDPGFRGTVIYASIHAHLHMDLSRRDDMISWFYVITDLLTGSLPWRSLDDKEEILKMKQRVSVSALLNPLVPEMTEVWQLINKLEYDEKPDYLRIQKLLQDAVVATGIHEDDPYDWAELVAEKKEGTGVESDNSESIIQNGNYCCIVM